MHDSIVLEVDSIRQPMAGIGRYAWELARRVPTVEGVCSVRFLSGGKWIDNVNDLLHTSPVNIAIRRKLANTHALRAAYELIAPKYRGLQLQELRGYVYHGTNFSLPPFSGKRVATIHDLSIFRFPHFHPLARVDAMKRKIRSAVARADFIITPSEYVRREVMNFFDWPENKIRTVYQGVSDGFLPRSQEETAAVTARYGLGFAGYVLCVGTIEPRKNIGNLLLAYRGVPSSLRARYPLVLVGHPGWQSSGLHLELLGAQQQGWLKYLGYVCASDLTALYSAAVGFVFPSHYEGFGLPVVEAMASGIPVITSDASALPEITRGATLLVPPDDVDSWSRAIVRMIEDDSWRSTAISRSVAIASTYSWATTAKETVDVYRTAQLS